MDADCSCTIVLFHEQGSQVLSVTLTAAGHRLDPWQQQSNNLLYTPLVLPMPVNTARALNLYQCVFKGVMTSEREPAMPVFLGQRAMYVGLWHLSHHPPTLFLIQSQASISAVPITHLR